MNIKDRRLELGLTQAQIALACSVSLVSYQQWERGLSKPNEENYRKLIKALKLEE